ncbi:hypothetical protein D5086_033636 [Populus alba]|uniref:Uncharacterized protein n=1 Tax=Populus alba TaxID=43335 RepID=A0ACC4AHH6_POPAL
MAGQHQIDSESGCVFEVPIQEVAVPASFIHYLAQRISGFNLDASLCVDLASLIASHAYHIEGHCRGFYVSAHVDLVDVDVNEVAVSEIGPILDSEGFTLPRGASETVLKKESESNWVPPVMANGPTSNGGIQGLNKAARLFNAHLKFLVDVGKQEMPGSNLVCQFIQDDQREVSASLAGMI